MCDVARICEHSGFDDTTKHHLGVDFSGSCLAKYVEGANHNIAVITHYNKLNISYNMKMEWTSAWATKQ